MNIQIMNKRANQFGSFCWIHVKKSNGNYAIKVAKKFNLKNKKKQIKEYNTKRFNVNFSV